MAFMEKSSPFHGKVFALSWKSLRPLDKKHTEITLFFNTEIKYKSSINQDYIKQSIKKEINNVEKFP